MDTQREVWATTLDNPFDYFKNPDEWRRFDEDHGYNTQSLIARLAIVNDEMSDDVFNFQIEQAVDEICRFNLTGNYRKVVKE